MYRSIDDECRTANDNSRLLGASPINLGMMYAGGVGVQRDSKMDRAKATKS